MLGGHFLLEWSLPSQGGWPLLPACAPSTCSSKSTSSFSSKLCYQGVPVLTWLHGAGGGAGHEATAQGAPSRGEQQMAFMIRILSLLVPREIWLSVPWDATWGTLCQEIGKTLRCESPLLAELCRPLAYHLMDLERAQHKAAVPEARPLRELFWAQSESLYVELESSSQRRGADPEGGRDGEAADGPRAALLIWREPAFRDDPLDLLPDSPAVESCFGLTNTLSRQMTEPVPVQTARLSRQMSEPAPARSCDVAARVSAPLLVEQDEFEPPLPGLPGALRSSSPERCVSPETTHGAEYVAEGGQPEREPAAERAVPSGTLDRHGPMVLGDSSARATAVDVTWENVVPHYSPRLLPRTFLTRQFEFHPTMPEVMLTGDKKGNVNILNVETDEVHPPLSMGTCPLLGLAWMRRHPQRAVCGASHSGRIALLEYEPHTRPIEPSLQRLQTLEEFPKLSSLSVNCTDDFLLASGISPNIAIYDLETSRVLHRAHGVHEHFINISRFCNHSPHIFVTASFDHTCKVWDLRQPLTRDRPVKTLTTGSHNVMCVFSPDDKYVLCSGVDTRIMQFEVPSWRQTPQHFPLREPMHRERYRRSTYLATGRHFVTAATEESHMHLMTVDGAKLGVVDFRGVVQHWAERGAHNAGNRSPAAESGCLQQVPCLARQLESRIFPARAHSHLASAAPRRWSGTTSQDSGLCAVGGLHQGLVQGRVQLDDADPNGGSSRNNHEFIQSIRTHPLVKNRVGVLLSHAQAERSYVALVDIDPRVLEH